MNRQTKGRFSEHIAIAALLRNGYAVYEANVQDSPVDLIAERDNELWRLQIKSLYPPRGNSRHKSWHLALNKPKGGGGGYHYADKNIEGFIAVHPLTLTVYLVTIDQLNGFRWRIAEPNLARLAIVLPLIE